MTPREPKPDWADVPPALREKIAAIAGEPIAGGEIAWGGYGPTASFVLTGVSGAKLFCKGTHPGNTPEGHKAVLRECANLRRFPELARFGPAFRGLVEGEGWHLMILEAVTRAKAVPPWTEQTARRAIASIVAFHAATPPQAEAGLADSVPSDLLALMRNWHSLTESATREGFVSLFADRNAARAWLDSQRPQLVALAAGVAGCGGPRGWAHMDLRSDNMIFAEHDRLVLVDWPVLTFGPQLLDIGFFLPSLAGEGGPSCAAGLRLYEEAAGTRFTASNVAPVAACIAGFFAARAGEPEMAALPRLRNVQKMQLFPALDWMCAVLGIAPPGRALASAARD